MEHVLYEELTPRAFQERLAAAPIAYIPLGTLEWHGAHLPLGSDGLQSQGLFRCLAREVGGVVLPMLFVAPDVTREIDGTTYIGMDFYGRPEGQAPRQMPGSAYHVSDGLYYRLLDSLLAQLARAGFKIIVAHGHGPANEAYREYRAEWEEKYGLRLVTVGRKEDRIGFQNDHAAANESSIMMHFHPDLIHMEDLDPDPAVFPEAVLGEDPRTHASAALGKAATEEAVAYLAPLLREMVGVLK